MLSVAENTNPTGRSAYRQSKTINSLGALLVGQAVVIQLPDFDYPTGAYIRLSSPTATANAAALYEEPPQTLAGAYQPLVGGRLYKLGDHLPPAASEAARVWAEMEVYRSLLDGWDGIESVAPNGEAIDDAKAFLTLLPPTSKVPEATVSADGNVGWFWRGRNTYIDITFLGDGRFAYYGEVGAKVARGVRKFDQRSIPQDLLDLIKAA